MKSKTPLPTTHPIYFSCIYGIHFVTLGLTFSSHLSLLAFTFSQCLSLPLSSLTFLYPISYHFNSSSTIKKVRNCCLLLFKYFLSFLFLFMSFDPFIYYKMWYNITSKAILASRFIVYSSSMCYILHKNTVHLILCLCLIFFF